MTIAVPGTCPWHTGQLSSLPPPANAASSTGSRMTALGGIPYTSAPPLLLVTVKTSAAASRFNNSRASTPPSPPVTLERAGRPLRVPALRAADRVKDVLLSRRRWAHPRERGRGAADRERRHTVRTRPAAPDEVPVAVLLDHLLQPRVLDRPALAHVLEHPTHPGDAVRRPWARRQASAAGRRPPRSPAALRRASRRAQPRRARRLSR